MPSRRPQGVSANRGVRPNHVLSWLIVTSVLAWLALEGRERAGVSRHEPQLQLAPAEAGGASAATAGGDDGPWTIPAKTWSATRYSKQEQNNTGNVSALPLAWTFSTGVLKGHEAAPLVVGDRIYVVTPYPNVLYALDLRQAGALKWSFKPKPSAAAQGVACCDVVNRGAAYADGRIFYNTLDNHTIAVDAASGREVWNTQTGDINYGESMTMAPLVVKGKVLVGNSGGEFGVRGWLTSSSTSRSRGRSERSPSTRTATATSTSWTVPPARSFPPSRSST